MSPRPKAFMAKVKSRSSARKSSIDLTLRDVRQVVGRSRVRPGRGGGARRATSSCRRPAADTEAVVVSTQDPPERWRRSLPARTCPKLARRRSVSRKPRALLRKRAESGGAFFELRDRPGDSAWLHVRRLCGAGRPSQRHLAALGVRHHRRLGARHLHRRQSDCRRSRTPARRIVEAIMGKARRSSATISRSSACSTR